MNLIPNEATEAQVTAGVAGQGAYVSPRRLAAAPVSPAVEAELALKQDKATVVSSNTTAANDGRYTVVATATFTDPSPVEGKGFTVFVRNGTATVGGTAYAVAGTVIARVFHSGAWANYSVQVDLAAHIANTTAAHAASAISFAPVGGISSTTTQGAIAELDAEKASLSGATFTGGISAPSVSTDSLVSPSGALEISSSSPGLGTITIGVPFGASVTYAYAALTDDRLYVFPDASGTIALTADITTHNDDTSAHGQTATGRAVVIAADAAAARDALGATGGVFPRNVVAASAISDVTNLQTTLDTLVVGPASATDNAIVRFDGATGKLTQDSGITISDVASSSVGMTAPASTDFNFSATGGLFQIFRAGNAAFRWFPANSGTAGSTAYMMSGGTNTSSSGTNVGISLTPTINSSGTAANIDLLVNRTQTSVGSGEQLLMDLRVGGVSRVKVSSAGVVTSSVSTGTAPFAVASTTRVANLNVARAGVADALTGYTVATLPAGTIGDVAYVTDATAPTYLGTLTGGGAVVCPVFFNGSAWVSH